MWYCYCCRNILNAHHQIVIWIGSQSQLDCYSWGGIMGIFVITDSQIIELPVTYDCEVIKLMN